MVCPYGRLQGVLLDPNSIVVGYDFKRGEPKKKFPEIMREIILAIVSIANNAWMYVPQVLIFATGHNWNVLIVLPA